MACQPESRSGTTGLPGSYQGMAPRDPSKSAELYAMATNLRHAADETSWPLYRAKLLEAARDLEREAGKRDQSSSTPISRMG
jgi:hypothetical protein